MKHIVEGEVVGVVSGESRSDFFVFTANPEKTPPLFDYVFFEIEEVPPGEDEPQLVQVVAQVHSIRRTAPGISPEHPWTVLRNLSLPASADTVIVRAKVLGYHWKGGVYLPRSAPPVGAPVRYATVEVLRRIYYVPPKRRLHIGSLISRPEVEAFLDIEGVKRHIAIIAATGAGKTWASVLLVEELLKKGATILVLDPHGEYVAMKQSACRLGREYCNSVRVVRVRDDQDGDVKYTISVKSLSAEELASVAGVPSKATRIRGLIGGAKSLAEALVTLTSDPRWAGLGGISRLIAIAAQAAEKTRIAGKGFEYFTWELARLVAGGPANGDSEAKQLAQILREKLGDESLPYSEHVRRIWLSIRKDVEPAYDALRYLDELKRLGVYGASTAPLAALLAPASVTVLNLSGLRAEVQDHVVYNVLARVFNSRLAFARGIGGEAYNYPVLVVLEEAHRFAPPKTAKQTRSREVIAMIASEGRKFGVFLAAITQRPSRIDQDVLSQLQGQIILKIVNPRDQDAVRDASEQLSQDLLENLPGLNIGEAVVLGPLSKLPVMVRLRDRVLEYSGGDLEVSSIWARSISDLRLVEEYRREALREISLLLGEEYGDLAEALTALLGRRVDPETVEEALHLLVTENVWATVEDISGTILGEAGSVEVKANIRDQLYTCSSCGDRVCSHVVAVVIRAVLDETLRTVLRATSEQPWWLGEYAA